MVDVDVYIDSETSHSDVLEVIVNKNRKIYIIEYLEVTEDETIFSITCCTAFVCDEQKRILFYKNSFCRSEALRLSIDEIMNEVKRNYGHSKTTAT